MMKRLSMKFLIAGIFMTTSTFNVVTADEVVVLPQAHKGFDFILESDDVETEISKITFKEHGILSLVVDEWERPGEYQVNDEHIIISYTESAGVTVNLYLSYDALNNDEITGVIQDVKMLYHAPKNDEYLTYHEQFLDKDYTLKMTNEFDADSNSSLTITDERLAELYSEVYILRYEGVDEYVYFGDNNAVWLEEREYQPAGYSPQGHYRMDDDFFILQMNAYDNGQVKFTLSYDDLTNDVIEGVIEEVEWISSYNTPDEFEHERGRLVGNEYEMVHQDRDGDLVNRTYNVDINNGSSGVTVNFKEDNTVEIEYLNEIIDGTFETSLHNIEVQFEETTGVTTRFHISFESLGDGEQTATGMSMTHEFGRDVSEDDRMNFESVLGGGAQ